MNPNTAAQLQDSNEQYMRQYNDLDTQWMHRNAQVLPSLALIARNLASNVTEQMLAVALASFRPLYIRIMHNKMTGQHRGFAFVEFQSMEDATAAVIFFSKNPLIIANRAVTFSFAENYRSNRVPYIGPEAMGKAAAPRLDWICNQCHLNNFSRRTSCFKCGAAKPEHPVEIPQVHFQLKAGAPQAFDPAPGAYDESHNECEVPSNVLVARMLPLNADEGALQVAFAEFAGVRDIRLVRDRLTGQSRGFAFIEFADVDSATRAFHAAASGQLLVQQSLFRISYAREGYHMRSYNSASKHMPFGSAQNSSALNSIAALALEQAQWALANGYNASTQSQTGEEQTQSVTNDDVSAFLESAAAAARPSVEEPRKAWPVPFEIGGGGYVYASDSGLYYDGDSMFYYDPQTKIYYNQYTGKYYQCKDGTKTDAQFELFIPPVPMDDAQVSPSVVTEGPTNATSGKTIKPVMKLSFAKPKALRPNVGMDLFSGIPKKAPLSSKSPAHPVITSAGTGAKRKHAQVIAKWSQVQRDTKLTNEVNIAKVPVSGKNSESKNKSVADALTDVLTEAPICLLCRRKFLTIEQLRKHEALSQLHKDNLSKAKQHKDALTAQYQQLESEKTHEKRHKSNYTNAEPASNISVTQSPVKTKLEDSTDQLESGFGGKMLKMMGWKKGKGLGKEGTGITKPVTAASLQAIDPHQAPGLGSMAPTSSTINMSEATTYRDKIKLVARARFEEASRSNTQ